MRNILTSCKLSRPIAAAAVSQGTHNGSIVDLQGFDSACFIASANSVNSGGSFTLKVQGASVNNSAAMTDLVGANAKMTDNSAGTLAAVEIPASRFRYLRPVVVTADENSQLDGCICLLSRAGREPVTHAAVVNTDDGITIVHAPPAAT